jgi:hypothetical protein
LKGVEKVRKFWKSLPPWAKRSIKIAVPVLLGLVTISLSKTAIGAWVEGRVAWFMDKMQPGASGSAEGDGDPGTPPEV